MRALLPFLHLFKFAKFPLFLGIILMILGLAASIGLLTLSGWFLSATAIAGVGALFNFFYPSASVRGLAIGRTAARYAEKIVTHDATFRILAKLRVQVFKKIIPLSPAVLNRYRNSDLLNRLVADVDTLDGLYLRLIAPFVTAVVVIAILTIVLACFNTPLALFIGLSLLFLLAIIPTLFYHLGRKFGKDLTDTRAIYRSQFVEFIQAQAELLLFNAQQPLQQKLHQTEEKWQSFQQKEANLSGLSTAILMFANSIILVLTLWFAADTDFAKNLAPDNQLYQAAIIGLFAFAALASFEILMPIGAAFLHIGQVIASAERINEVIDHKPLVNFNGNSEIQLSQNQSIISLQNVTFNYPQRHLASLKSIELNIQEGKKVAILGKTGSGKSTLLQLLVRNYDAQQGQVFIGQQKIQTISENSLRQHICFLTQRVHIFSDTLRNNLQIASNKELNDDVIRSTLRKVGLATLLDQDEGLNLWLGDGGRPLSGGEQRRLGLARVLLNDAPILLLDEPTEGLDRETERHILNLILQHCKNKTLVMVTHRITYIERFDHLCIMDDAKLVEQGSFEQLNHPSSLFRQLTDRII